MSALARRRQWIYDWTLLILAIAVAVAYFPLNSPHGTVHSLQTPLDRAWPLVPIFAIPYLLMLPVFWLVFLYAFIQRRGFRPFVLAVIAVFGISNLVYLLFQTVVVRPAPPTHGMFASLIRYIYSGDSPYNDFPSGHAEMSAMLATYVVFINARRWIQFTAALFSALVVFATLFVKQHYVADAIAGTAFGIAAIVFFFCIVRVETSPGTKRLE